mgnify:CR=1 FL=1
MMLYTTLNRIKKCGPCGTARDDDYGFRKLLNYLSKTKSDDEQLSFKTILESNGLDDAIWCLRSVDGYDLEIRLFAVACARRVEHLDPTGQAKKTNDVSERFAHGLATIYELNYSRAAASLDASLDASLAASRAASRAASLDASLDASRAASRAASLAAAAWAASLDASLAASRAASLAAASLDAAAWAASLAASLAASRAASLAAASLDAAAWAASLDASLDASRDAQREDFIKMFCTDDDVNEQI